VLLRTWSSQVAPHAATEDGTLFARCSSSRLFWLIFLGRSSATCGVFAAVEVPAPCSAWLAGGLVALLSLLIPPQRRARARRRTAQSTIDRSLALTPSRPRRHATESNPGPWSSSASVLPLALMAKRRSDLIRQHQFADTDYDVDESIELLRALNPMLLSHLRQMIGERRDGVVDIPNSIETTETVLATSTRTSRAP